MFAGSDKEVAPCAASARSRGIGGGAGPDTAFTQAIFFMNNVLRSHPLTRPHENERAPGPHHRRPRRVCVCVITFLEVHLAEDKQPHAAPRFECAVHRGSRGSRGSRGAASRRRFSHVVRRLHKAVSRQGARCLEYDRISAPAKRQAVPAHHAVPHRNVHAPPGPLRPDQERGALVDCVFHRACAYGLGVERTRGILGGQDALRR